MHDDGVFNDCQLSDQEFDDEVASVESTIRNYMTLEPLALEE